MDTKPKARAEEAAAFSTEPFSVADAGASVEPDSRSAESESRRPSFQDDFEQAMKIGDEAVECLTGAANLARLELMLAVRSAPQLVTLWLLMMPIALLLWLSFSAMVSWAVYAWSGTVMAGLTCLFALHLVLAVICRMKMKQLRHRMAFSQTRSHVSSVIGGIKDELGNARSTGE